MDDTFWKDSAQTQCWRVTTRITHSNMAYFTGLWIHLNHCFLHSLCHILPSCEKNQRDRGDLGRRQNKGLSDLGMWLELEKWDCYGLTTEDLSSLSLKYHRMYILWNNLYVLIVLQLRGIVSGQSQTLQDSKICIYFFVNTRFSHSLNLKKRFKLFCSPEKKKW